MIRRFIFEQDTAHMNIISELQRQFLEYLESQKHGDQASALYTPIDYIMSIGGKRLRPTLLLLACGLYKEDISIAKDASYAVELFHNFTLMHDDIMDDADLRRGKPSAYAKYGSNQTILSGDVMLIESYKYLCKYDDAAMQKQLLAIFNKMAVEVCEGQQMDVDFETRDNVEISEYLKMIELKTAVLLAASLEMGAILGGASADDQRHIYAYGINAGIAFQIQDDILDAFGDESFGKKIGGDIAQNKKTYLYLKALELGGKKDIEQLTSLFSDDNTVAEDVKIAEVTRMFKSLLVKEYADQLKEAYLVLALSHLDALSTTSEHKDALKEFTNTLITRSI